MKITTHAREQLRLRLAPTNADPDSVIKKLERLRSPGFNKAIVLHRSTTPVQCADGSNGYYLVAIVRLFGQTDKVKTVFWSRDLDARRFDVTSIVEIN